MRIAVPATSVLWFFNPHSDYGTASDAMEKYRTLEENSALNGGLEILLLPRKLRSIDDFDPWFNTAFSRLRHRSVHIGDADEHFLAGADGMTGKLELLAEIMERMGADRIVVHASHLLRDRMRKREILQKIFPRTTVLVENNGWDSAEGSSPEVLSDIFRDCPKFQLCLDVCHTMDCFGDYLPKTFTSMPELMERIGQIHFSCSMAKYPEDSYAVKGFTGYIPGHALWSVIGESPHPDLMMFVERYPVVLEGVQPPEDHSLNYLKNELMLFEK